MAYLEYLRARRIFVWFAIVLVGLAALAYLSVALHGVVNVDTSSNHANNDVPVAALFAYAALCALGVATALAASFNRETAYAHFTWIRPLSRTRMALLIASVDIVTIVLAGLFALAVGIAALSAISGARAHYVWLPVSGAIAVSGLGVALMWYAMLQVASAWTPGRGGPFVGIAAAVFGTSLWLSHVSWLGPVAAIFRAILYLDPLAYLASVTMQNGTVTVTSVIGLGSTERIITTYGVTAAALVIATYLWKRVEV